MVVFLVLQFAARPYLQDRMDFLEGLCSVSIFFYVFAAAVFAEVDASHENSSVCDVRIGTHRAPRHAQEMDVESRSAIACISVSSRRSIVHTHTSG